MKILIMIAAFLCVPLCVNAADQAVRMGSLQNDLHHLPLWVAQEKSLFDKAGVKVDKDITFRAGPEMMSAFKGGSLDMGYVGEAPTTIARARDKNSPSVVAQVNLGGSALVIGKDNKAQSITDLKGAKIAVPGNGTVQDFLLRKAAANAGLGQTDINIITLAPPEMGPALKNGQIDGFVAWQPFPAHAVTGDFGRVLLDSADIWPEQPCCVIVATEEMIKNGNARKIAQAHKEAVEFIKANPEEAIAIAVKRTGMDEQTIREAFGRVKYETVPTIAGEAEYVDFLNKNGYIEIPNEKIFIETLIQPQVN